MPARRCRGSNLRFSFGPTPASRRRGPIFDSFSITFARRGPRPRITSRATHRSCAGGRKTLSPSMCQSSKLPLCRQTKPHQREDSSTERRALLSCLDLYRGDLLPGLHDEWIETHRERLKQKYSGVLESLIALFEQARDYPAAIRHAESLLSQDPFQETVYQAIMRLHGLNGDRAEALRAYQRCATVLRRELGVEPGIATRRIRDQISRAEIQPPPASEVLGAQVRTSSGWARARMEAATGNVALSRARPCLIRYGHG